MKHHFKIKGDSRSPRILSETTLLGVFAILQLPSDNLPGTNPRTLAAKFLRLTGGMGVDEAYTIVDFIATYGVIDKNGEVMVKKPEQPVEYTAVL